MTGEEVYELAQKKYNCEINVYSPNTGTCIHKRSELMWMLEKAMLVDPCKNFLEIGLFRGGGFLLWSLLFHRVCSIDLNLKLIDRFGDVYDEFRAAPDRYCFVDGFSQKISNQLKVKKFLNGEMLDGLFIDGGHSYSHVVADYCLYRPMVRSGGIVIYHDVCHGHIHCEVPKFIKELRDGTFDGEKHNIELFCETTDVNQNSFTESDYGVGVEFIEG